MKPTLVVFAANFGEFLLQLLLPSTSHDHFRIGNGASKARVGHVRVQLLCDVLLKIKIAMNKNYKNNTKHRLDDL